MLLLLEGIALGVFVYGFTLRFGFDYDDYHLLRPYTLSEVARTLYGPWDPSGVEVPFYRPVTVTFYAIRFWALGVDAWKYHLLSLVMFAAASSLFGLFVSKVSASRWAGAVAVVFYALQPAAARSQVVWATNQMHLLMSLLVGAALVWWAAAGRTGRGWSWAVLMAAVALLIKEDGIMLLPLLITLQILWRTLADSKAPWPPLRWLACGFLVMTAVVSIRYIALGGLGGYSSPPAVQTMWNNYQIGIRIGFLLNRTDGWPFWFWTQNFTAVLLVLGVLGGVFRGHARLRFLLLSGFIGAALFNLPFVIVTKAEQYHLIASFSAVALTASALCVWRVMANRWWRLTVSSALALGLVAFAAAARHRAELFTPYTAWTLGHDEIVTGWTSVPAEIRGWLSEGVRKKRQPHLRNLSELPVIVFGAFDFEAGADGRRVRWIGERTVILPNPDVRMLELPLAASVPLRDRAFHVDVEDRNGRVAAVTLKSGDSTTVRVPLRQGPTLLPLSRRVTVTVTPGWRMKDVVPASADATLRTIRLGEIRVLPPH